VQGTVYISRPERSWIRTWRWCRRRHQRSCWGGIYVHPDEGIQATSAPLWPSGRRCATKAVSSSRSKIPKRRKEAHQLKARRRRARMHHAALP
jgi:hypothetical protein